MEEIVYIRVYNELVTLTVLYRRVRETFLSPCVWIIGTGRLIFKSVEFDMIDSEMIFKASNPFEVVHQGPNA